MGKNSWIMFGLIAIVIISILLVALLILVPQSEPITQSKTDEYEKITESDYSYTESKDIDESSMKETYGISVEDVKEGKAAKIYKPGNTDPFEDQTKESSSEGSSKSGSSGSSSTSGSGNSSTPGGSSNSGTTGNSQKTYTVDDK